MATDRFQSAPTLWPPFAGRTGSIDLQELRAFGAGVGSEVLRDRGLDAEALRLPRIRRDIEPADLLGKAEDLSPSDEIGRVVDEDVRYKPRQPLRHPNARHALHPGRQH